MPGDKELADGAKETPNSAEGADGKTQADGAPAPEKKDGAGQTDAEKAEAAKAEADKAAAADKKTEQKQGAPAEYADFALPEGVQLEAKRADSFKALAKKHGLTQEAAQEFVNFEVQYAKGHDEAQQAAYAAERKTWKDEMLKSLGADAEKKLAFAAKVLDRKPALRTLLVDSGLGDRIEIAELLIEHGRTISEDTLAEGKKGAAGGKSLEKRLYPDLK